MLDGGTNLINAFGLFDPLAQHPQIARRRPGMHQEIAEEVLGPARPGSVVRVSDLPKRPDRDQYPDLPLPPAEDDKAEP